MTHQHYVTTLDAVAIAALECRLRDLGNVVGILAKHVGLPFGDFDARPRAEIDVDYLRMISAYGGENRLLSPEGLRLQADFARDQNSHAVTAAGFSPSAMLGPTPPETTELV